MQPRSMPPWLPDADRQEYKNQRVLTQEQIYRLLLDYEGWI